MSKPKWAEKSLNEFKWALMNSNFNKTFTSDADQCKRCQNQSWDSTNKTNGFKQQDLIRLHSSKSLTE